MYIVTFTAHQQRNMVQTPHYFGAGDATATCLRPLCSRSVISTFSWRPNFLYIFQCHRTIEKLKKNNTSYVVI